MTFVRYTNSSNLEEANMAHRREQGNVLGFVLVGALLVALLLGGIYMVRHTISQQDGGVNVASNEVDKAKDESKTTQTDTSANGDSKGESEQSSSSTSDSSLQDALNAQSSKTTQTTTTSTGSTASGNSVATGKLPETGPADILASVVSATLLVGATVSYARSRRVL